MEDIAGMWVVAAACVGRSSGTNVALRDRIGLADDVGGSTTISEGGYSEYDEASSPMFLRAREKKFGLWSGGS